MKLSLLLTAIMLMPISARSAVGDADFQRRCFVEVANGFGTQQGRDMAKILNSAEGKLLVQAGEAEAQMKEQISASPQELSDFKSSKDSKGNERNILQLGYTPGEEFWTGNPNEKDPAKRAAQAQKNMRALAQRYCNSIRFYKDVNQQQFAADCTAGTFSLFNKIPKWMDAEVNPKVNGIADKYVRDYNPRTKKMGSLGKLNNVQFSSELTSYYRAGQYHLVDIASLSEVASGYDPSTGLPIQVIGDSGQTGKYQMFATAFGDPRNPYTSIFVNPFTTKADGEKAQHWNAKRSLR